MKRLLLLPLLALCLSCSDSNEPDVAPQVDEVTFTGDFRAGNWGDTKQVVFSRDIAPVRDEGNLVLMPVNKRNQYDVYEFSNDVLVGGLIKGSDIEATYNRLLEAYGAPAEQGYGVVTWFTSRSQITFYDHGTSMTVYYTPR